MTTPEVSDPGLLDEPPRRPSPLRRAGWVAAGVFTVATFGLWIYAIFFYDPGLLVDELEDRTFPTEAEGVCASAMARLEQLPRAEATEDPLERARVVREATAILSAMVDDLRLLAPTTPARAEEAVNEWLDDWETHLSDRLRYADALGEDPAAPFVEQRKGDKQVSRAIDGFAQVNRMTSCETPGDVG